MSRSTSPAHVRRVGTIALAICALAAAGMALASNKVVRAANKRPSVTITVRVDTGADAPARSKPDTGSSRARPSLVYSRQ